MVQLSTVICSALLFSYVCAFSAEQHEPGKKAKLATPSSFIGHMRLVSKKGAPISKMSQQPKEVPKKEEQEGPSPSTEAMAAQLASLRLLAAEKHERHKSSLNPASSSSSSPSPSSSSPSSSSSSSLPSSSSSSSLPSSSSSSPSSSSSLSSSSSSSHVEPQQDDEEREEEKEEMLDEPVEESGDKKPVHPQSLSEHPNCLDIARELTNAVGESMKRLKLFQSFRDYNSRYNRYFRTFPESDTLDVLKVEIMSLFDLIQKELEDQEYIRIDMDALFKRFCSLTPTQVFLNLEDATSSFQESIVTTTELSSRFEGFSAQMAVYQGEVRGGAPSPREAQDDENITRTTADINGALFQIARCNEKISSSLKNAATLLAE